MTLIETKLLEYRKQREELKNWLYGTIHKQYDTEETVETVQEDVDRYFSDEYFKSALEEVERETKTNLADKMPELFLQWRKEIQEISEKGRKTKESYVLLDFPTWLSDQLKQK